MRATSPNQRQVDGIRALHEDRTEVEVSLCAPRSHFRAIYRRLQRRAVDREASITRLERDSGSCISMLLPPAERGDLALRQAKLPKDFHRIRPPAGGER
jgi:hypothetical protein